MRTILLGDIGNRLDIADAEHEIDTLHQHTRDLARDKSRQKATQEQLLAELGRQKLAITALTRFLIAKGLVSESELQEFIHQVDSEDGLRDGKLAIEVVDGRTRLTRPPIPPGTYRPS